MIDFSATTDDDDEEGGGEPAAKKKKLLTKQERDEKTGKTFNRDHYKMQAVTALRRIHQGLQMQSDGVACLEAVCHETPAAELPSLLHAVGLSVKGMPTPTKAPMKVDPTESETQGESEVEPGTSAGLEGSSGGDKQVKARAIWCGGGGTNAYKCSECGRVFGSKSGCQSHCIKAHSGEWLLCPICPNFSTANFDSLNRHLKRDHGKSESEAE